MNNKALSNILAVIFLTAMTVVIALIAWNAISLPDTSQMRLVGVVISENQKNTVSFIYVGGRDSDRLLKLIFEGINSTGGQMRFYSPANSTHNSSVTAIPKLILDHPKIGDVVYSDDATERNDHVIVIAEFEDGVRQVIFDAVV